jgi:hypothetical protein
MVRIPGGAGLGPGINDQAVPSHRSARLLVVLPVADQPTATQALALVQDTWMRSENVAVTTGTGRTDQATPFHASMSTLNVELDGQLEPTAMQKSAFTQDTPSKEPEMPGRGLGTTDHLIPSHRSVRSCWPPTAKHDVALAQDTADSELFDDEGFGDATTDHPPEVASAGVPPLIATRVIAPAADAIRFIHGRRRTDTRSVPMFASMDPPLNVLRRAA